MKHYDVLFIHPSAVMSSPQFVVMPMGMISLMNQVKDYQVKAVNVGLELSLDKNFDMKKFLKSLEFDVVGIDLHWHEHSYTSLEIAHMCKEINENCLVVLGGATASYFAKEILQSFEYVDVVVSGEAEEALPLLVEKKEFSCIPNVAYREDGYIKKPPAKPPSSLDNFDFSTIVNLHHWEEYLKCSIHAYSKTRFWHDFWLCTGRGCIYDCSYCGGGKSAQKKIFGRENLLFRSVDCVVKDLTYLQNVGVHIVCPSLDFVLAGEKYWRNLFTTMKKEGIYMGMYLEVFQLPSREFVEAFASACDPRFSTIVITVLSGSETVRRSNGKYFSNHDYFKCIESVEGYNINHVPYFATGLPFETEETFKKTMHMTEKLLSEFHPMTVFCTPLRLDPGSPMFEHPDHYGVIKHYKTFTDYYNRCRKRAKHLPYDYTGYHTRLLPGKKIMGMQHQWDTLMKDRPVISQYPLHFV